MTGVHYVDVNGRSVPIPGRKRIGDRVGMSGRQQSQHLPNIKLNHESKFWSFSLSRSSSANPACNVTCSLPHPSPIPRLLSTHTSPELEDTEIAMVYGSADAVHPGQQDRSPLCCYSDSVRARQLFVTKFPFFNELNTLASLESSRSKWLVGVFSGLSLQSNQRKHRQSGISTTMVRPSISFPPHPQSIPMKMHRMYYTIGGKPILLLGTAALTVPVAPLDF